MKQVVSLDMMLFLNDTEHVTGSSYLEVICSVRENINDLINVHVNRGGN